MTKTLLTAAFITLSTVAGAREMPARDLQSSDLKPAASGTAACNQPTSIQHCYIWVGTPDEQQFLDRKNVNFTLAPGPAECDANANNGLTLEVDADAFVKAKIVATWDNFDLQLIQKSDGRVLESGLYARTGRWGDYQGFSVITKDGNYTLACASLDP